MGEIESELDSVLNQYHDKQEHIRETQRREQDEHRVLENEFRKLFSNIVEPNLIPSYARRRGRLFLVHWAFLPSTLNYSLIGWPRSFGRLNLASRPLARFTNRLRYYMQNQQSHAILWWNRMRFSLP